MEGGGEVRKTFGHFDGHLESRDSTRENFSFQRFLALNSALDCVARFLSSGFVFDREDACDHGLRHDFVVDRHGDTCVKNAINALESCKRFDKDLKKI